MIIWTTREIETIVGRAAELHYKKPFLSPIKAIIESQAIHMPRERQRNVNSAQTIGKPTMLAFQAAVERLRKEDASPTVADLVATATQRIEETKRDTVEQIASELSTSLLSCITKLVDLKTAHLTKEIEVLRAELSQVESMVGYSHVEAAPAPSPLQKLELPRVVIYGPTPQQAQVIQNEWRDKLDVTVTKLLADAARPVRRGKSHLIVMPQFTAGLPSDLKRKALSIQYANGGINSINHCLTQIHGGAK